MNTTAQFLAKFNNVSFTATEHNKVIGDYRGEKIEVSITTKIPEVIMGDMAVQAIIRVEINGRYVMSWGSDSNECNMELVIWFRKTEGEARKAELEQERIDREHAERVFEIL
jgi:hypothetical protein